MIAKRHDIWSGPIIGYGNASGLSAGGKFKRPDDVDFNPKAEARKSTARKPNAAPNKNAGSKANTKRKPKRKNLRPNASVLNRLNIAEQKLARAEKDKRERAEAAKRLRYLQSCLMRLGLLLATYVGDADGYLDIVEAFPFEDGYSVVREAESVIVKNDASKNLHLKALASDDHLTLGLHGGKNYKVHAIEARCSAEYIGRTWRIENLW